MIETRPPRIVPLRYSPKPISAYNVTLRGGIESGPGHSALLCDDIEAWNLAFLSHQYEVRAEHYDERFTVLVRRTVNTLLATGEFDILGRQPARLLLRSLLRLPAAAFIDEIRKRRIVLGDGSLAPLLEHLPMHKAYGEDWLETMRMRVPLCLRAPVASEFEPGDEVPNVDDAASYLKKFR